MTAPQPWMERSFEIINEAREKGQLIAAHFSYGNALFHVYGADNEELGVRAYKIPDYLKVEATIHLSDHDRVDLRKFFLKQDAETKWEEDTDKDDTFLLTIALRKDAHEAFLPLLIAIIYGSH